MKTQKITNLILLIAMAITIYLIGSTVDNQLAKDVNQNPITLTK
jgi:hypothetical protein